MNYELSERGIWGRLRARLTHAFALPGQVNEPHVDDLALLDRFACLLTDRGLATPAIFFVESLAPLGFLGGQLVHFLTPILEAVAPPADIERLARLLERRETPSLLVDRLRWFDDARFGKAQRRLRQDSGQAHHRCDDAHHRREEEGRR